MAKIRITKEFRFEGAHSLKGYDGKCSHIHGHSYKLEVTVIGEPITDANSPKYGMVIDFSDLKAIVNDNIINKFDHALILSSDASLLTELSKSYGNTVVTLFQPTSENLVTYFAMLIRGELPENVELYSLRLWETSSSYAEWYLEDNLPAYTGAKKK